MVQKYHHIEIWSAIQNIDVSSGEFVNVQQKVVVRACPTNTNLGSNSMGEMQNVEFDFNYTYLKWMVGDKELCEIDQFNMICKMNGEDLLAGVRAAVGL